MFEVYEFPTKTSLDQDNFERWILFLSAFAWWEKLSKLQVRAQALFFV